MRVWRIYEREDGRLIPVGVEYPYRMHGFGYRQERFLKDGPFSLMKHAEHAIKIILDKRVKEGR